MDATITPQASRITSPAGEYEASADVAPCRPLITSSAGSVSAIWAPLIMGALLLTNVACATDFTRQRAALVAEVEQDIASIAPSTGRKRLSPAVLKALGKVPRHLFVPEDRLEAAYDNRPLPIGYGQTISQPLIVGLMSDLLEIQAGDRVFELGTGSGYQAAILDAMGAQVFSMEIVEPLGDAAKARLNRLGYRRVQVKLGDGYHGWEDAGPFDAIIVTAAGDHIPPPLVKQLKRGGHMVLPVGGRYFAQKLVLVTHKEDGSLETRDILPVRFVPLTGQH